MSKHFPFFCFSFQDPKCYFIPCNERSSMNTNNDYNYFSLFMIQKKNSFSFAFWNGERRIVEKKQLIQCYSRRMKVQSSLPFIYYLEGKLAPVATGKKEEKNNCSMQYPIIAWMVGGGWWLCMPCRHFCNIMAWKLFLYRTTYRNTYMHRTYYENKDNAISRFIKWCVPTWSSCHNDFFLSRTRTRTRYKK